MNPHNFFGNLSTKFHKTNSSLPEQNFKFLCWHYFQFGNFCYKKSQQTLNNCIRKTSTFWQCLNYFLNHLYNRKLGTATSLFDRATWTCFDKKLITKEFKHNISYLRIIVFPQNVISTTHRKATAVHHKNPNL